MRERRPPHPYPRTDRVNELLREVLADEVSRIDDEQLSLLSVTGVDTEPDLRHATVYLSSLPDEAARLLARRRPALQRAIGRQVRLKRTPELAFRADPGVAAGARVEEILRHLHDDRSGGDL